MKTGPGRDTPVTIDDDQPAGAPEPAQTPRLVAAGAAWTVLGLLALIALGRLVHLDDAIGAPYPRLDAYTPLLYLPAYAVLATGFALRRNLLMAAAAGLIAVHLAWTLPEVWPGRPPATPAGATIVRLFSTDLHGGQLDAATLGGQIRARRPDVVVLTELSPAAYAGLTRDGALAGYRYRVVTARDSFGTGVFARFPLTGAATTTVGGVPLTHLTVAAARPFTLFAVQTSAPTSGGGTSRWRAQLAELRRAAAAATGPVVLAGDFNATRDNRPLRRLTGAGLRDAHDAAGAGWAPTWDAASGLLPPTVRLDHVLASRAFVVTGYGTGGRDGGDHRPVVVDLAPRG